MEEFPTINHTFFEDGIPVPFELVAPLRLLNDGNFAVLVDKDGSHRMGTVMKGNDGKRWYVGGVHVMTAEYAPFKVTVHDPNLLTIVNVTHLNESWV